MNISLGQWACIVALDILIKVGFLVLGSGNPFNAFIALFLSFLHLIILVLVNYSVLPFRPGPRRGPLIVLGATNVLVVTAFVVLWVSSIKSGSQTACGAVECQWVNGTITSSGVHAIIRYTVLLVSTNLAPVLLVLFVRK